MLEKFTVSGMRRTLFKKPQIMESNRQCSRNHWPLTLGMLGMIDTDISRWGFKPLGKRERGLNPTVHSAVCCLRKLRDVRPISQALVQEAEVQVFSV